ncbi:selenocysteine-specific translation elongation factor [Paracoccus aerodenitrificans]|uniref:selenocysteine-specific translation elongation factor n=1 Tax=Paracoccus aerodenitrificans TaxID=3017781 RepID=UPI0022EFFA7F|nr:selenocysteine-specific translation elongation factor [Paracoccus aerodenitrificans]WBU65417.1 selenocysteine-specific translation elongation factor [Paracoccus aerodenitrificans]
MIVGTAGHIDHGKTALVKALTGTDADRLAEEKKRGITIDLGFAYADLGDGSVTGFVDMPGHERLIHNMISGAGGIDAAMIVIAADDGIMPQTSEHLEILSLLAVRHAVVVISKSDLADQTRLSALRSEIEAKLDDTPMRGAPVIAASAVTGQGIDALRLVLSGMAGQMAARSDAGLMRLIVDRSFTLEGAGTVVTGMLVSGAVKIGDEVLLSPSGLPARVRGIRAQDRKADCAGAGARVALNLAGIGKDQISRGDVVLTPGLHAPTDRVDGVLRWIDAKPFASGARARFHAGAADAEARLVSLEGRQDGAELVQIVLDRPLALNWHEAFILRDPSASRTLGGGRLLDLRPPARKRATEDRRNLLAALSIADADTALREVLAVPPHFMDLDGFLRDRSIRPDTGIGSEHVILGAEPRIAISHETLASLSGQIADILAAFHAENPDQQGMPREALRLSLQPRLPKNAFTALLRKAVDDGRIVLESGMVRLPDYIARMSEQDEEIYASIAPQLGGDARFRPPRVRDFAGDLKMDEREIRRMLKLASRLGRVDEIARDHFFLRGTTIEMASILRELSNESEDGWFAAPAFRDRLQNGRKVAIQILDFFDRYGLTLRKGDLRRVNSHRSDLFAG